MSETATAASEPNFDLPPSVPAAAVEAESWDWLRIESACKMPYDKARFSVMQGTGRVWACDGEYVACRPKKFHEGTHSRHQRFLAAGHYEHVGTFDDVQIFKLLPGSPYRRDTATFLPQLNLFECMRQAQLAAVARDWVLFVDILEEIAGRIKQHLHEAQAKVVYDDILSSVFAGIQMRRGPSQAEVDAGVHNVRKKRGFVGKMIAVPQRPRIQRAVFA
jgi:hypothetical protein